MAATIEIQAIGTSAWSIVNREDGNFVNARQFPKGGVMIEVSENDIVVFISGELKFDIKTATLAAPSFTDLTDLYNQLESIVN